MLSNQFGSIRIISALLLLKSLRLLNPFTNYSIRVEQIRGYLGHLRWSAFAKIVSEF